MKQILIGMAAIAALAACGGGGGGGSTGGGGGVTPPTSNPPTNSATVTGNVIDHESGQPLAGVKVGLAAWTAGAAATPVATTDANGNFSFSTAPGKYLLVIGSDSASDTRPTIHDAITVTAPSTVLVAPTMPPVPTTTPVPIEQSGKYRLTTLTSSEQSCLSYENSKRASKTYAAAVPDEWLTENNRQQLKWATSGSFGGVPSAFLTGYGAVALGGVQPSNCSSLIDGAFAASVQEAQSAVEWYAGAVSGAGTSNVYTVDNAQFDPRGTLPAPQPYAPWP